MRAYRTPFIAENNGTASTRREAKNNNQFFPHHHDAIPSTSESLALSGTHSLRFRAKQTDTHVLLILAIKIIQLQTDETNELHTKISLLMPLPRRRSLAFRRIGHTMEKHCAMVDGLNEV